MSGRTTPGMPRQAAALAGLVLLCFGAAGVGSLLTAGAVDTWYPRLDRPAWTPPSWVFAPVWTALYLAMAVAAWLVWRRRGRPLRTAALAAFGVQLALNAAWSPVFFGLESIAGGLAVILPLWAAIACTIGLYRKVSVAAAVLMLPYLAWVTFAAALNIRLLQLNG